MSEQRQELANVHIEHYFPKGYNPDEEPWKSIKAHHNAALAAERKDYDAALTVAVEQAKELAAERELREGDNKLIRALAEDAGIKITASDKLLGAQWEQFHDGVMQLAGEREKRESIESINKSLAQALDAERSNTDDLQLVLGALDSLGVALADHGHQWTEGERAIYEKAVEIVTKEDK
jgi:hypothetical protein